MIVTQKDLFDCPEESLCQYCHELFKDEQHGDELQFETLRTEYLYMLGYTLDEYNPSMTEEVQLEWIDRWKATLLHNESNPVATLRMLEVLGWLYGDCSLDSAIN